MNESLMIDYISSIDEKHRKEYGQFFTESRIARFLAGWVLKSNASILYDPAFGLGAMYHAARSIGFEGRFCGAEIDPTILSHFRASNDDDRCAITPTNYLAEWGDRHQAIICNPPYFRFHHFVGRNHFLQRVRDVCGITLSGFTNIASAFLVKSVFELLPYGRLAYILPLEFLNTGYGVQIKKYLLESGSIKAIIQLDCEKDIFPEVTTSVGIILFEKKSTLRSC